jgi:DNA-binding response OmpR family regulator
MKKQACILVVDDVPQWNTAAAQSLRKADFTVDSVDTIAKTRICLNENLYHVLVLDICFEDGDNSNQDGLEFLYELEKNGLTEAIQVVMFTNFSTKERLRETFRDFHIADFIEKSPFNEQRFVEDIKNVFQRNAHLNLDMNVRWSQTSGPEALVIGLKLPTGSDESSNRVTANTPLQKRVANELEDLLRRLFYEAENILVRPITPGRSGSGVLWVRPFYKSIGGGSAVVVKFGSAPEIQQEYKNYREFVERLVGGGHSTNVHEIRRTTLLGGISYSFLGATGKIEDFEPFYKRSDTTLIKQSLDSLFLNTCKEWYANANRLELLDLAEDYQKTLHVTPPKLQTGFSQLRIVQTSEKEYIYLGAAQKWGPFVNPLCAFTGQNLAFPTYSCTTHGDFNQHNLQVDSEGHIWMIDFQGTGHGHILRDLVALDTVVRFQLLTTSDATMQERMEMEQILCTIKHFSEVDQLEGQLKTPNANLQKAFDIAVHLRKIAYLLVRHNPNDDFNEYYAGLLFNALNIMRFPFQEQEQREHALLSASLLAQKLGIE